VRKLVIISGLLLAPMVASAATPSEGVPLKVRRGFFTETDLMWGFLTLGGQDSYSNLQVYLQLGIGYDITENIEIGLHVGIGANAANCWGDTVDTKGNCLSNGVSVSDNFTVTFIDLSFAYLFRVAERVYVAPKIVGGWTLLDPAPVTRSDGTGITNAPNVGLAVGVEYATNMDHFTIGFDWVVGRFIIGPNIFSMQFYPRIKYTF
jgi:hypothetical protein